ncbi:MAG: DoxX family protein [Ramlibacter sp.]|nr:DoxX family protein [Ramlibacter sp.]
MTTRASNALAHLVQWWERLVTTLNLLQPAAALAARIYVGQAFFMSGLTKIRDWDITLALFTDEYHVPFLPPAIAAPLGTAGELVLPVLLVLGLGGRFAALGLFVVNLVAVNSLQEVLPAALQQHILWGSLLAGIAIYGPGAWSLERVIWPRVKHAFAFA